jgi:N-acyl-D-amino-acid deacylase
MMSLLGRVLMGLACLFATLLGSPTMDAADAPPYDMIIAGGTVYDGSGRPGVRADVGIRGDRIDAIGDLSQAKAITRIDARNQAVAPGFINMLSWAPYSLLHDGRSQSDLRQGVTLELFGEGWSLGPLNERMKRDVLQSQGEIKFHVEWTTLMEFLQHLERRGVSCNVASLVGAASVRIHELGYENRAPTPEELVRMQALVRAEMEQGALGIGSALIYAPGTYAKTDELVALCKVAAEYDGLYMSHIRSEGDRLLAGIDEFLTIAREANIAAESRRSGELGQAGRLHRPAHHRPRAGPAHHGRHVFLRRCLDRARCRHANLGARRWLQQMGRAAARRRDAGESSQGNAHAVGGMGKLAPLGGLRR